MFFMKGHWKNTVKLTFYASGAILLIGILGWVYILHKVNHTTHSNTTSMEKRIIEAPPPVPDHETLKLASPLFENIDPEGNIFLYVSNQSFAITPVDITVRIDGKPLVNEMFAVGNQHRWKRFCFRLLAGKHEITASSKKGKAKLRKTFTVKNKQWAVLDYWYYPETRYNACPKQFTFEIFDKQVSFQ